MFYDREDGGQQLGRFLSSQKVKADIILGLPRGGVVTAAALSKILKKPLGVLVVRKLGLPGHSEFAVGAIAEGGIEIYNAETLATLGMSKKDLAQVLKIEKIRLMGYIKKFRKPCLSSRAKRGDLIKADRDCRGVPRNDISDNVPGSLKNKVVMLVDDGIATGLTTKAAILACKKFGAKKIIVTAPVASTSAASEIDKVADKTYFLKTDPLFAAVGQYYQHFDQTTDEEVQKELKVKS